MESDPQLIRVRPDRPAISVRCRRSADPWLVLLHGLQTSSLLWEPCFSDTFFDSYSLLALDFVGFGDSEKPEDFSYSVQEQAQIVEELLDTLEIPQCHIIGHSMGAMTGVLLAQNIPQRVLSLVNMEGNMKYDDCGESAKAAEMDFEYFAAERFPALLNELRGSSTPSAAIREASVSRVPDYVFHRAACELVELARSETLLEAFQTSFQPKLLVIASDSRYSSRPEAPSITIADIPGSSHFMTLDQPTITFEKVKEFLSALS